MTERGGERRVALFTGGSRASERAIALALAKAGHRVAVNYRVQADEAEAGSAGASPMPAAKRRHLPPISPPPGRAVRWLPMS